MSEPDPREPASETTKTRPDVSVIICTHNPDRARFSRALSGLADQTLSDERWEIVVVDNRSAPPVGGRVEFPSGIPAPRHVSEPELGLTPARLAGIREARAGLLVFVDDDNVLEPSYLEEAVALFEREPQVGAAGGVIEAEYETPPPAWAESYVNLLGIRNFGDRPMRALVYNQVGPWEPIGAGMVIRADIARRYAESARNPLRRGLDRQGTGLGSCGDTDMARCAPEMGYYLAYQPSLRMTHLIPGFRLRYRYFLGLCRSLKRSGILLDRIRTGQPSAIPSRVKRALKFLVELFRRLSPSPHRWGLEMAAVYGELQARAIPDEALAEAGDP